MRGAYAKRFSANAPPVGAFVSVLFDWVARLQACACLSARGA